MGLVGDAGRASTRTDTTGGGREWDPKPGDCQTGVRGPEAASALEGGYAVPGSPCLSSCPQKCPLNRRTPSHERAQAKPSSAAFSLCDAGQVLLASETSQ